MTLLWIPGILLCLIVWLCLTRVGAQVVLENGSATVDLQIGLFHVRVFPAKRKRKKKEKTAAEQTPKAKEEPKTKKLPKIALADIKDAVQTLWPPLKRALNRTRKGIRIAPLDMRVTLGGAKDPAQTAELYGYIHAGIWVGMPVLEKVLDIPDPYIHVGMDFDASELTVHGKFGVTARIGTLLAVAFGIAIPALRWFLRFRKKLNSEKQSAPQPTA